MLSPWLANGALSVRRVAQQLFAFEETDLKKRVDPLALPELLWREFFHWRAINDGPRLFCASGTSAKNSCEHLKPGDFARWCAMAILTVHW